MNILMLYPKYPDTFWSFKHALKFISKKAAFPPLGLLTVGSLLPDNWNKKLVDVNVEELKDKDIQWADMVFVSAMMIQKDNALELIDRCKEYSKTVVAGGPAFMAEPESFSKCDYFILDEAEVTLPMFLEDLEKGETKPVYSSKQRPDITQTPLPMWSLIDMKKYATMPVQYSRGCPFNCEFCDIELLNGKKTRAKTPQQMRNELQVLYDAGWQGPVFIVDDNFIGNKKNVKAMLPEIVDWQKEHDIPFAFFTEASVNLAEDKELMDLMVEANFNKVFLGLETPCKESLQECNKTQNLQMDLSEAVKVIHQHGMQVMGGFILGFDSDPENIFESQIKFIQQIGVVTAMVGMLGAIPHTKLWKRLKSEGRLLSSISGDNTDGSLNFIPKMGRENLMEGYKRVISTIYKPRLYYKRINTFIKNYQPRAKTCYSSDDIKALFRSFLHIGIFSRSSMYFWKTILKTSLTKIRALPTVIELAIYGYHFEKVAKRSKKQLKFTKGK